MSFGNKYFQYKILLAMSIETSLEILAEMLPANDKNTQKASVVYAVPFKPTV